MHDGHNGIFWVFRDALVSSVMSVRTRCHCFYYLLNRAVYIAPS